MSLTTKESLMIPPDQMGIIRGVDPISRLYSLENLIKRNELTISNLINRIQVLETIQKSSNEKFHQESEHIIGSLSQEQRQLRSRIDEIEYSLKASISDVTQRIQSEITARETAENTLTSKIREMSDSFGMMLRANNADIQRLQMLASEGERAIAQLDGQLKLLSSSLRDTSRQLEQAIESVVARIDVASRGLMQEVSDREQALAILRQEFTDSVTQARSEALRAVGAESTARNQLSKDFADALEHVRREVQSTTASTTSAIKQLEASQDSLLTVLRIEVRNRIESLSQLADRITGLESSVQTQMAQFDGNMHELRLSLSTIQQDIQTLTTRYTSTEGRDLRTLTDRIEELESQIMRLKHSGTPALAPLTHTPGATLSSPVEDERLAAAVRDIELLKHQCEEMEKRLADSVRSVESVCSFEHAQLSSHADSLSKRIDELRESVSDLSRRVFDAQSTAERAESDSERCANAIQDLRNDFINRIADIASRVSAAGAGGGGGAASSSPSFSSFQSIQNTVDSAVDTAVQRLRRDLHHHIQQTMQQTESKVLGEVDNGLNRALQTAKPGLISDLERRLQTRLEPFIQETVRTSMSLEQAQASSSGPSSILVLNSKFAALEVRVSELERFAADSRTRHASPPPDSTQSLLESQDEILRKAQNYTEKAVESLQTRLASRISNVEERLDDIEATSGQVRALRAKLDAMDWDPASSIGGVQRSEFLEMEQRLVSVEAGLARHDANTATLNALNAEVGHVRETVKRLEKRLQAAESFTIDDAEHVAERVSRKIADEVSRVCARDVAASASREVAESTAKRVVTDELENRIPDLMSTLRTRFFSSKDITDSIISSLSQQLDKYTEDNIIPRVSSMITHNLEKYTEDHIMPRVLSSLPQHLDKYTKENLIPKIFDTISPKLEEVNNILTINTNLVSELKEHIKTYADRTLIIEQKQSDLNGNLIAITSNIHELETKNKMITERLGNDEERLKDLSALLQSNIEPKISTLQSNLQANNIRLSELSSRVDELDLSVSRLSRQPIENEQTSLQGKHDTSRTLDSLPPDILQDIRKRIEHIVEKNMETTAADLGSSLKAQFQRLITDMGDELRTDLDKKSQQIRSEISTVFESRLEELHAKLVPRIGAAEDHADSALQHALTANETARLALQEAKSARGVPVSERAEFQSMIDAALARLIRRGSQSQDPPPPSGPDEDQDAPDSLSRPDSVTASLLTGRISEVATSVEKLRDSISELEARLGEVRAAQDHMRTRLETLAEEVGDMQDVLTTNGQLLNQAIALGQAYEDELAVLRREMKSHLVEDVRTLQESLSQITDATKKELEQVLSAFHSALVAVNEKTEACEDAVTAIADRVSGPDPRPLPHTPGTPCITGRPSLPPPWPQTIQSDPHHTPARIPSIHYKFSIQTIRYIFNIKNI